MLYLFIAVLVFFSTCANKPPINIAREDAPKSVTNYLTEQYKDFPRTKLSILPDSGFTYDVSLDGFTNESKRSWVVAALVQGKPLLAAGLYKARISDQSRPDAIEGTLLEEWDVSMSARPSKLFKIVTPIGGDDHVQYVLFTGDTTAAYRITGSVHEDEIELAPKVKKSILSIFFDPERISGQSATQTSASPCNCPK